MQGNGWRVCGGGVGAGGGGRGYELGGTHNTEQLSKWNRQNSLSKTAKKGAIQTTVEEKTHTVLVNE